MIHRAHFAYAQARLQARHGMRPDDHAWAVVQSIRDLSHFLQTARTTALRPWVLHIGAQTDIHTIELTLKGQFRRYVYEVAGWQPTAWRKAILWVQRLLDLPALQHLFAGEPVPSWMLEDEILRPFATENMAARLEAVKASDCAVLLRGWLAETPLTIAWLEQCRRLWPADDKPHHPALNELIAAFQAHIEELHNAGPTEISEPTRKRLAERLTHIFRRRDHQPAAALAHLGLVALDMERLRGELTRRVLFPQLQAAKP